MRKYIALSIGWILALGGFIYLTMYLKQPSNSFWGIVQSEKTVLRSPESGEIQWLKVKPGDSVRTGDTILVLFRPEVERQQQESQLQISQIDQEFVSAQQELEIEMQETRIAWESEIREVEHEKELWKARLSRDRELAKPWLEDTLGEGIIDSVISVKRKEFEGKISSLNQKYKLILRELAIRLQQIKPDIELERERVENDLEYWETICEQQVIRAPHSGWVGEVMVNETELTLKGTPLVEIWGHQARYVEGYIHENFTAELKAGEKVSLISANDSENEETAHIIKLGNRIVEFPDRLRKSPEVRLWGRETIIELDLQNDFLIGEKVMIQVQ